MPPVPAATTVSVDVVIWGGGTGGVAAAVQAARGGVRTLLLTPGPWLGGMLSAAGVCAPDGHELSCWQTGLWGAFLRDIESRERDGLDQNWVSCFGFRPETAESLLRAWVADEPTLDWWPNCRLDDVQMTGDRITTMRIDVDGERHEIHPNVVIEGSDLGDLIAKTGLAHRWGWEAKERWDEPSAPEASRLKSDPFFQEQPIQSPTWVSFGQFSESQAPQRQLDDPRSPFDGCLKAFGLEKTLSYGRLPRGLVMLNWPLQGNDWHGGLHRAISADPDDQRALETDMQGHSLAFLDELQRCSGGWLQAGEGIPGSGNPLALMPYWREGRRLIGRQTVTERDLLPLSTTAKRGPLPRQADGTCNSIAVGTYANDHHYPGEDWPLAPKSCQWGGRWTGTPFCIPYDALVSDAASNLLVAEKGFSVSHMANGATRLQPLILNLGQVAGLAAAQAVQQNCSPTGLSVRALQLALIHDATAPAAVLPLWEWPWWHPNWRRAQLMALDSPDDLDDQGKLTGANSLKRPTPDQTPPAPHQEQQCGRIQRPDDARFVLETNGNTWPLITLEPAVASWLADLKNGSTVDLRVVRNPWGPWLRVLGVNQLS